jgi:hypothetical protein
MKTVALSAHYDGKKIELDEPYPLPENAQLVVGERCQVPFCPLFYRSAIRVGASI